jgi:hypothetical protein
MWTSEIISCKINKEMFKGYHTLILSTKKGGLSLLPKFLLTLTMPNRKRLLLVEKTKVELLPHNGKLSSF